MFTFRLLEEKYHIQNKIRFNTQKNYFNIWVNKLNEKKWFKWCLYMVHVWAIFTKQILARPVPRLKPYSRHSDFVYTLKILI